MEQLCIFEPSKSVNAAVWRLFIDGASRGNPGPAGAGIVIKKENTVVQEEGYHLGVKTNNQAEYYALLLGIWLVKKLMHADDQLIITSDSQLLVRQLQGLYKVKDAELHKLFTVAKQLLTGVSCQVRHVLREQNKEADAMANKGIETKHAVPAEVIELLAQHHINIF